MKNILTSPRGKMLVVGAVATAALVVDQLAFAGSGTQQGANTFNAVWDFLKNAMEGSLGRVAAGTMVLVGVIAGIAQQSLMGFATGVGAGVGLYTAPTVINSMVTATLPAIATATTVVSTVSNGL